MDKIETRTEMSFRIEDAETRTVTGIAVPYEVEAHGEVFARDAVTLEQGAKLFWQHEEPIGLITHGEHTEDGYKITAKVSSTSLGNDVMTMLRDGVVDKFSVGFQLRNYEIVDGIRRVTDALVRECSVVVFPWYSSADITAVRNGQNSEDETSSPDTTDVTSSAQSQGETMAEIATVPDAAEVRELAENLAHLERKIDDLENKETTPAVESFRSVGQYVRALSEGDDLATRVYSGSTTADAVVTPVDRYLENLVADASPLGRVFSSGVTPATGMSITYAKISAIVDNTGVQSGEGEALGLYSIEMDTDSVNIDTIGSGITMSRQAATRATVPFLDAHFRGQALALGKAENDQLRTAYLSVHAAQVTATNTVIVPATGADISDWIGAAVDASAKMAALGLRVESLLVSQDVFKGLAGLLGADGRPIFAVAAGGSNIGGTVDVPGISGNLAGINVVVDTELADDECAFVNSAALRQYKSAALRLSNSDALTLTEEYSLSTYAAVADEVPSAVVPVIFD